ncbi:MAG: primosomal protein N' [Fimbriimonadaceae bacterium]|nr:primosomal protein N' [Fimbriimonadaceae bacterium]
MKTAVTYRVADIALDVRSGGNEAVFTYAVGQDARPGDGFFVTVGNRAAVGYAIRVREVDEEDLGFPASRLKSVEDRIEGLSLPEPLVDLVHFVSAEYLCSIPSALSAAMPPGVADRVQRIWTLNEDALSQNSHELTALQKELVEALRAAGGSIEQTKKAQNPTTLKAMKALRAKGIVRETMTLRPESEDSRGAALYHLTNDREKIEEFLSKNAKKRPAQALVVMRMQEVEEKALRISDIKGLCGVAETTVKSLIESAILERESSSSSSIQAAPSPNKHQQITIEAVTEAVQKQTATNFLLYGITGSGKTEVYLRAAAEALRKGRQVLYLVPEIALAAQAIAQLRQRFGGSVAVLHSELLPRERLDNWVDVRQGRSAVVLGARSAIFAPLSNIGLIILDEEHENSYKQESSPRYHTKTLARHLGKLHSCPVVLGSATPSVESFTEAENEDLVLLSLPERAANAQLPAVHIEDLTGGYRAGSPSILTDTLLDRMEATIKRGEQAILFLNRRAYAPFLICRDCGHQFHCPQCSVSLAYSRRDNRLRCHQCGYFEAAPTLCADCRGTRIRPFGVGTEKVEEAVKQHFPAVRVDRLDRDVAQRKGALEKTLAAFGAGETQVLVGTQMVAKGLNFPNVTLVGVIAADVSLNIPDFRATERTFQLLSQVAGRAGRGQRPGEVVIQTFNPEHHAILCARDHDFIRFFEAVREERREVGYPPFRRLVNIVFSGEGRSEVGRAVRAAADALSAVLKSGEILGPVDCPIERIQNRWRMHLIIKLPPTTKPDFIADALSNVQAKNVQIVVDVDPYSLM